jgi:hypothetical protein
VQPIYIYIYRGVCVSVCVFVFVCVCVKDCVNTGQFEFIVEFIAYAMHLIYLFIVYLFIFYKMLFSEATSGRRI